MIKLYVQITPMARIFILLVIFALCKSAVGFFSFLPLRQIVKATFERINDSNKDGEHNLIQYGQH